MKRKLCDTFTKLVEKMAYIEKKVHLYGTEKQLSRSGIHAIYLISHYPGVHVTGIPDKMGITRSASSQLLAKLEKNGMISRKVSPEKQTKMIFSLTDSGREVDAFHDKLHREFNRRFEKKLSGYTAEEKRFLERFIAELSCDFDKWMSATDFVVHLDKK